MQNEYINKLERVLYFVINYDISNMKHKKSINGSYDYFINDNMTITKPYYDLENITILRYAYDTGNGISVDDVVKVYSNYYANPETAKEQLCNSYYEENYYRPHMFFNNNSDSVDFHEETIHHVNLPIPDYNINEEAGEFQYSLLHDDEKLGIMKIIQYFYLKGHLPFSDSLHPEFDKIYEELNEQFNIGREDYLLGN